MKNILKILSLACFVFIITGCSFNLNFTPNFSEFKYNESFSYILEDAKDLTVEVDACKSYVEVLNYDGSDVLVEMAYDDQNSRDKINFVYSKGNLDVSKRSEFLNISCWFNVKVSTYIRISIPNHLNDVHFELAVPISKISLDTFSSNQLIYQQINGNISIANSEIDVLNLRNTNGDINMTNTQGSSLTSNSVNGAINLREVDYTSTIKGRLTNGQISLQQITASNIDLNNVNGKIIFEDISVSNNVDIKNTNGKIIVTRLNNLKVTNNEVIQSILDISVTNGDITLNEVYSKGVELKTVNGDISFVNSNKDYRIDSLTYDQVNGGTHFDVNATIINN